MLILIIFSITLRYLVSNSPPFVGETQGTIDNNDNDNNNNSSINRQDGSSCWTVQLKVADYQKDSCVNRASIINIPDYCSVREASELATTPSPDYTATPQEDNLFEWHFTLRGPPGNSSSPDSTSAGPYADGMYHGRIVLPPTYPLRPPSFRFLTPSGRFETNREICLSISGHHEETWQPAWGLRTALVAYV